MKMKERGMKVTKIHWYECPSCKSMYKYPCRCDCGTSKQVVKQKIDKPEVK